MAIWSRGTTTLLTAVVGAVALWCAAWGPAASTAASVPAQFHGVSLQNHLDTEEVDRLENADVGVARFLVSWQATEPRPGVFDWTSMDTYLEGIERSGAKPLPFIAAIPDWVQTDSSGDPMSTVSARNAWRDFMVAMVDRYGPKDEYDPYAPDTVRVKTWQIWNEPNLNSLWGGTADPASYARMVEIASDVIREGDPEAEIMLAGLAPAQRSIRPWTFMRELLASLDTSTFDTAALHPYAEKQKGVNQQVKRVRKAMNAGGADAMPLALTEFGWSSSRRVISSQAGTPKRQARHVTDAYRTFARNKSWNLSEALWYSLRDSRNPPKACGFCTTSGLLRAGGKPKPAWKAFKRSIRKLESTETGYDPYQP